MSSSAEIQSTGTSQVHRFHCRLYNVELLPTTEPRVLQADCKEPPLLVRIITLVFGFQVKRSMVWKDLVWCDHCVRWNMTLCRSESHAKTRVASVSNQGAMLGFEIDFCHFSFDKTICSSFQLYAWYLQHVLTTGVSRCNLISFDCGTLISLYQLLQSRNTLYNGATPIVLMYNGCILGPIDNHVVQQGTNCMETH